SNDQRQLSGNGKNATTARVSKMTMTLSTTTTVDRASRRASQGTSASVTRVNPVTCKTSQPICMPRLFIWALLQNALQHGPLALRQPAIFEKTHQQMFARTFEDAVEHVAEKAFGNLLVGARRLVNERPLLVYLLQEAFFVKDAHEVGDRGVS